MCETEPLIHRLNGFRSSDGGSERLPCTGKVAISGEVTHTKTHYVYLFTLICQFLFFSFFSFSDIRIPLMWKDSEYFKNKGGEFDKYICPQSHFVDIFH